MLLIFKQISFYYIELTLRLGMIHVICGEQNLLSAQGKDTK